MTCQCRSMSRTFFASRIQRLVSQAHGQSGSNQKSTRAVVGALCTASVIGELLARWVVARSDVRRTVVVGGKAGTGSLVPGARVSPGTANGGEKRPAPVGNSP